MASEEITKIEIRHTSGRKLRIGQTVKSPKPIKKIKQLGQSQKKNDELKKKQLKNAKFTRFSFEGSRGETNPS